HELSRFELGAITRSELLCRPDLTCAAVAQWWLAPTVTLLVITLDDRLIWMQVNESCLQAVALGAHLDVCRHLALFAARDCHSAFGRSRSFELDVARQPLGVVTMVQARQDIALVALHQRLATCDLFGEVVHFLALGLLGLLVRLLFLL